MAQDLRHLDAWVTRDEWPHVACPTCSNGYLVIEELKTVDSGSSKLNRNHEFWEPDWLGGTFAGSLRCSEASCQEGVAVSGEYKVDEVVLPNGWQDRYDDFFKLRFALPALVILETPAKTPESVKAAIVSAAEVIWVDPNAAANRLRLAVEEFLTAEGVRRYVNRNGKRHALKTQNRIDMYKKLKPDIGDAIEAVKWIGNTGSHESALTPTHVLDGAALLHYALRLRYDKTDKELQRQVKSVTKRKGRPLKAKS